MPECLLSDKNIKTDESWQQSKKEGKDQESIQSSTTPDPGYKLECDKTCH